MADNKFEIKLTPEGILKQQFKSVRKGYDSTEVDNYLDTVITDYETFLDLIKTLENQNTVLRNKIKSLESSSTSWQRPVEKPEDEDRASTNFDIIQRLSKLERKVFNLEQELHPNE